MSQLKDAFCRKAKICQLLNIFSSDLFVSSLVWLQSGCYVGDDTFIINSANRRLFWGTQGKMHKTHRISCLFVNNVLLMWKHLIVNLAVKAGGLPHTP